MTDLTDILVADGLVPDELLDPARDMLEEKGWTHGWKSNQKMPFGHWHIDLTTIGRNRRNRHSILTEVPIEALRIWALIQPAVSPDHPTLMRCYANAHVFGCDGYSHQDSMQPGDRTNILFLCKTWDHEWAGENVIFDETFDVVQATMPRKGRVLSFPSELWHAGRGVSRVCPEVRAVLVFKARCLTAEELAEKPSRD